MASPGAPRAGRVSIEVIPDASDFENKLRSALANASRLTATVAVDIDAQALRDSVANALRGASATVRVTPSLDTSGLQRQVDSALRSLGTSSLRLSPSIDVRSLRRQLASIQSQDLKVTVDVSGALDDLARVARAVRSLNRSGDQSLKIEVKVDADFAKLDLLAGYLDRIGRSRTININVNGNFNDVSRQITNLTSLLSGQVPTGGIVGALTSIGVAAVGIAALTSAIAAASTLIAPFTGALGALGAAAAAVGLGTRGVSDALTSLADKERDAAAEAAAAAKTRETAQRALKAAQDAYTASVTSSARQVQAANQRVTAEEKALAGAQRDATAAQKGLTEARASAKRALEDLQGQLIDGNLSVRQAEQSLIEAQARLAEVQKGLTTGAAQPLDLQRAALDVEVAQRAYDKAITSAQDLQQQASDANAAGIDGAPEVVRAQERVQAATEAVAAAEQAVTEARVQAADVSVQAAQQVADAQQRVADAQATQADAAATIGPSTQKAQTALDGLTSSATAFALSAQNVKDQWSTVGDSIQEALFFGLGSALAGVSDNLLPAIQAELPGIAQSVNAIALAFADFLADPATAATLQQILQSVSEGLAILAPTVQPVSAALLSFFAVTADSFPDLAPLLTELALGFADIVANLVETGLAQRFTDAGIALAEAFTPEVLNALTLLVPQVLELAIASAELFAEAAPLVTQLAAFATTALELATAFTRWLTPAVADLADNGLLRLVDVVNSIFGPLSDLNRVFSDGGASLVQSLIDGIGSRFGDVATTMQNLVKTVTAWLPGSPAEVGPLSGRGYSLYRGRALVEDFVSGLDSRTSLLDTAASGIADTVSGAFATADLASAGAAASVAVSQSVATSVSATAAMPPVTIKFIPEGVARQVRTGEQRLGVR